MTSQTPDMHTVLERLEKLERQSRRLKRAALAAPILPTAILLTCHAPNSRTVEAEKFDLADSRGRVRVSLYTDKDSHPILEFLDTDGKMRANLYGDSDRTVFTLYDATGAPTVMLDASKFGPGIYLSDRAGHLRLSLGVEEDAPHLKLSDPAMRSTIDLKVAEGATRLELYDSEGYHATFGRADLKALRTGETYETSAASLVLFDKKDGVIWRAP